jgi:hypothetical protein
MKPVKGYFYSESEWNRLGCGPLPEARVWNNRNVWNDPSLAEQDYLVYPEPQSIDSDEKINPYSKV